MASTDDFGSRLAVRGGTPDQNLTIMDGVEVHNPGDVIPTGGYVVRFQLPVGLVGLMIAAIFAAAMSSIAAELNSLSTATVIDFDLAVPRYLVTFTRSGGGTGTCAVEVFDY